MLPWNGGVDRIGRNEIVSGGSFRNRNVSQGAPIDQHAHETEGGHRGAASVADPPKAHRFCIGGVPAANAIDHRHQSDGQDQIVEENRQGQVTQKIAVTDVAGEDEIH